MIVVSIHRSNLMPHERSVPATSNPNRACNEMEAGFSASPPPTTAMMLRIFASVASSISFSSSSFPIPRPRKSFRT